QGIGNAIPQPVKVFYRFKNEQKAGLGMPLPAGTVRVYQADSQGGAQFAGEDAINHTPKDETLRIYVGNAFDVVCERKQTDYKKLASDLYEMEYPNYKWTKLDVSTIGFEIPVEKDGSATLDYRVRVKW